MNKLGTLRVIDQHIEFKGQITETKSFSTSKCLKNLRIPVILQTSRKELVMRIQQHQAALEDRGYEEIELKMEQKHLKVKINKASNQLGDRAFSG